jgi:hypothetical protein
VSESDAVLGVAAAGHTEHGHVGGVVADAVVKDHDVEAIWFPAGSRAPPAVAVYPVPGVRPADGVNVALWFAASYEVFPATGFPPASASAIPAVPAWIGSLNAAVTVVVVATPVAPEAGVRETTVGGVVSTPVDVERTTSTQ